MTSITCRSWKVTWSGPSKTTFSGLGISTRVACPVDMRLMPVRSSTITPLRVLSPVLATRVTSRTNSYPLAPIPRRHVRMRSGSAPYDHDSALTVPFIEPLGVDGQTYDIIVVGSGAGGGQTAYTLTMDGARVLMLEAGRKYDPALETPMFQTPDLAPLRETSTSEKPFGFYDATIDGGWQGPGEPYVQASNDAPNRFDWWRARMLGGRTNHWGRISF